MMAFDDGLAGAIAAHDRWALAPGRESDNLADMVDCFDSLGPMPRGAA
jgi:hypothetical protein